MRLLILNSAEPAVTEFAENIAKILQKKEVTYDLKNYRSCLNTDWSNYRGILISGSPQGDDIVEHHQPYFQWIKSFPKPIMGICAGHHITGAMYGAEYLRSLEPESGDCSVEIVQDDPIFKDFPKTFIARQMHNDSISLPHNFIHLAQSSACYNQAMKHTKKPLYTFQFHPEYLNPKLIENFVTICADFAD
ncbi:type 1 glutamine amidotransferase [Sunxiuqinia sp. sy24]|uniref:type 1 glutamine amidotransferase n=1 Tax=Sunxiuqinia sp. sy24 TaxID=3461495 RepID=UPI004045C931